MKQKLYYLFFFLILVSHFAYGQDPEVVDKKDLDDIPFGEMEIEVRITSLYSNTYQTGATTRHRWYVKAFNGATTYATYSKEIKDNERPQYVYPNKVIYRNYVQTASLGSVKIDFYGFEDNFPYGALPGDSDKRDNRYFADLNNEIDFNSLKLGDNYVGYNDPDGLFKSLIIKSELIILILKG